MKISESIIYLVFSTVFLLSSCSKKPLTTVSTKSRDYQLNAHQSGLVLRPLLADMSVESVRKEVKYTAPLNENLRDPLYLSKSDLKSNALQLFITMHNCDYVVDPVFTENDIRVRGRIKEYTIQLTGFPAKYTKIYQADSLPKSITQFDDLKKPYKILNYINSISDNEKDKFGLEVAIGNIAGFQLDYLLKNKKAVNLRTYFGFEFPLKSSQELSGSAESKNSGKVPFGAFTKNSFSFSLGLMPEFLAGRYVKFRLNGGINISSYLLDEPVGFKSVTGIGLRVGGGVDVKLYKRLSLVGKFHSNINFANVGAKTSDWDGKLLIKDFKTSRSEYVNFGVGLRVTF